MRSITLFLILILLWTTLLIPSAVDNASLSSDPISYVEKVLKNSFDTSLSEYLINGIRFSFLKINVDSREKAERIWKLLSHIELRDARFKMKKFIANPEEEVPVPLFDIPVAGKGKLLDVRLDFALPTTGAASKKEALKVIGEIYSEAGLGVFSGMSDLIDFMKLAYCYGWINEKTITYISPPLKIAKYLKIDLTPILKQIFPPFYNREFREEFCYSDKLEKAISVLKPVVGISVNYLQRDGNNWKISSFVTHDLKLENILPILTPGKYYLPFTIPVADKCGEVLNVIDIKSFDGSVISRKIRGSFNMGVSVEPSDYLLECVTEKFRRSGWMEFSPSKITEEVLTYTEEIREDLEPLEENGELFLPVIGTDFSPGNAIKNVGGEIKNLVSELGKIGENLTRSVRIMFSGEEKGGGGMVLLASGEVEVRLSKKRKQRFSTIMVVRIK